MSKYVSTLIYLLSFLITILEASPIELSGIVVDSKNRDPLIGANVILSQSDKDIGAATDEFGNYLISNIKFGKYAGPIHNALDDIVYYRKDFNVACLEGYSRFSATTKERFEPIVSCIIAAVNDIDMKK